MFHEIGKFHHVNNLFELVVEDTFHKVVTHMWHTLYVNVFFFLKYNHAVDEVDIDEGCQKYVDVSKFYQNSDV
jgi:hypothetical protein